MRHLLAVDLDAPVLVVVPSIFGVGAQASSSGHALGVDAILENTLVQDQAVTILEDTAQIARRVLGGAHPTAMGIEEGLQKARAALRAREMSLPGYDEPG